MEKKISKLKVGLCALLGYEILNITKSILFTIACILLRIVPESFLRFRLEEIAFSVSMFIGYMFSSFIGEKLLKNDDAVRRYNWTIGLLFVINFSYFIIDYFRYGEGELFYFILPLLAGIYMIFTNKKSR